MKNYLFLLLIGSTTFTACKKNDTNKPKTDSTGTVMLAKIIDNSPNSPSSGLPFVVFNYTGAQLTQMVQTEYDDVNIVVRTDVFTYNSQGQLTGTTISYYGSTNLAPGGEVRSAITYSGNNISDIKFYLANDVLEKDVTLTYQNGNLTGWYDSLWDSGYGSETNTNAFNSSNQCTSVKSVFSKGGTSVVTNNTFDTQKSLSQTIPFWLYFYVVAFQDFSNTPPSVNNPLSFTFSGTGKTYTNSYQYNSAGYPTVVNLDLNLSTPGYPLSFKFEYTTVK